ncbi:MAG: GNAT family N-acetyltransferase [Chloroflexota bacterium]|nr:GNAT family N-acetyltransferase [Chloroflexota bacterium]
MSDVSPTIALVAPEETIETARLALEPVRPDHAPVLYPGLRDAALYRLIPREPPTSVELLEERYRRLAPRRSPDGQEAWLNWALRLRDATRYVGTLEATVLPTDTAYVAYVVFVSFQGRGYAREELSALLDLLFDRYGVDTVVAEIDTRNAPSITLVERLGFARVATHVGADHFKGTPSDEHRYELGRSRWRTTASPRCPGSADTTEEQHV